MLGDPDYTLFLPVWLANDALPLALGIGQALHGARAVQWVRPAR